MNLPVTYRCWCISAEFLMTFSDSALRIEYLMLKTVFFFFHAAKDLGLMLMACGQLTWFLRHSTKCHLWSNDWRCVLFSLSCMELKCSWSLWWGDLLGSPADLYLNDGEYWKVIFFHMLQTRELMLMASGFQPDSRTFDQILCVKRLDPLLFP